MATRFSMIPVTSVTFECLKKKKNDLEGAMGKKVSYDMLLTLILEGDKKTICVRGRGSNNYKLRKIVLEDSEPMIHL